jgi:transcriptional regulator with XRE-family HTH domain
MVSENIRLRRLQLRLSQRDAASKANFHGLDQTRWSLLERGLSPRLDELHAIARALDLRPEDLRRPIVISTSGVETR